MSNDLEGSGASASQTAALVASPSSPSVSTQGFDPLAGCAPADFTDDHRTSVCRIGQGAECCRYLTMGGDGWLCAKLTSMAWTIDSRVDQMRAKGDNCDGVYVPRQAFRLKADRFKHKAGTIIYHCKGHDYGLASDDRAATGKPHTSMSLKPSGDYPFFTVPDEDFEPVDQVQS